MIPLTIPGDQAVARLPHHPTPIAWYVIHWNAWTATTRPEAASSPKATHGLQVREANAG